MEICDIINHTEEGPGDAVRAIKKRLHQVMGKNSKTALFTLTILETCVKNCRRGFLVLICSKEFVTDLTSLDCPSAVREQVLGLTQSWATAFSSDPAMRGVADLYEEMKAKGVTFPAPSTQDIVLTSAKPPNNHSSLVPCHGPSPHTGASAFHLARERRPAASPGKLNEDQLRKLRQDLDIAQGNVDVFNELLSELTPGEVEDLLTQVSLYISDPCRNIRRTENCWRSSAWLARRCKSE